MNIITCLKEVPGPETRYQINADSSWIKDSSLTMEISECDEYALEEALKLREKHGGEVTVLTLGRKRSEKSIRKALAMGADRGILIRDKRDQASSPLVVAAILAATLRNQEYDLVLAGTQSDDYSHTQTGVLLAELLGLPHATIVMKIEAQPEERKVKALREMENGWFEWLEIPMPAVLTIQAGISRIRYVSLRGIMQARKKEIQKVELKDLGVDLDSLPQLKILQLYFPKAEKQAEMLEGDVETVASKLVEKLKKEERIL